MIQREGAAMGKTLYLLRHAKSSWSDATIDDHDRPLQAKGERRAAAQCRYLEDHGIKPDLVLCSTAQRARQTYDIVASALGQPEVRYESAIYEAEPQDIIALVNGIDDRFDSVVIVGHDPTFQILAATLAMTATGDAMERVKRKFPTCGLATLTFGDAGWSSVGKGVGHLEAFHVPQDDPVA
jgi:phosphohistidine phosphatase